MTCQAFGLLETGGRFEATLDLEIRGQLRFFHLQRLRHLFQLDIAPMQHRNYLGIETDARFRYHFLHGFVQRERPPILTVRRQRVQTVHSREYPRSDRDVLALQTLRISGAVPFFVMVADNGRHRVGEAHSFQDLGAHHRMNLHLFEFFPRQFAGLRNDVFGNGQLADVVQQRGRAQSFQLAFIQAHVLAHFNGVHLHPLQMVVRGVILGFNRESKRFDGSEVQRCHLFGVFLIVFHSAEKKVIGTVDQINDGNGQQRPSPTQVAIDRAGRTRHSRAQQIVGERPEVALPPDLPQRFSFRKSDSRRHRKRVHDKKDRGCHQQR